MSEPTRILVTGAAGFLGQALVDVLTASGFSVRSLDVAPVPEAEGRRVESIVGSVADEATVAQACAGQNSLVIAHMAPSRPEVYASPTLPLDINVKGTALLFDQAIKAGMSRVVLISSISVVDGHRQSGKRITLDLPYRPTSLYALTKTLQEEIAIFHHRQNGLPVAILRPAYVTNADTVTDKYGRKVPTVNWQFIDRRDIAHATVAALRAPGLTLGRYFLYGHPAAPRFIETEPVERELGWKPRYDFSAYPDDPA